MNNDKQSYPQGETRGGILEAGRIGTIAYIIASVANGGLPFHDETDRFPDTDSVGFDELVRPREKVYGIVAKRRPEAGE